MINFHKFGFLDCKRLINYFKDDYSYINQYNPIWMFVNSDYYKFEISFTNEIIYIRYKLPDLGLIYYPPLGNIDHLDLVILDMINDSKEAGYDFKLGPILERDLIKYKHLGIKLYDCMAFETYIYQSFNLSMLPTINRNYKKNCKYFEFFHKDSYIRKIKKEDFPNLIEFISKYKDLKKDTINELLFIPKLNILKKCMEHLYELDIIGYLLEDSENIYGFVLGSVFDNITYVYMLFGLPSEIGAYEEILMGYFRHLATKSKYAALPIHYNDKYDILEYDKLKPLRKEKFYLSFDYDKLNK